MGFSNVVRGQDETVTSSTPDTVAGYIFTRAADLYGRCIALVGRGDAPHDDGSSVFVDVDVLRTTANHHLITQGVVYPTYYRALFPDLRNELTAVAKQARDEGFEEIAYWFETLAKAERSHANRFQKALDTL